MQMRARVNPGPVASTPASNPVSTNTGKLKDMLSDTAGPIGAGSIGREGATTSVADESLTSLVLDQWSMRRGESIAQKWTDAGLEGADVNIAADVHGALFEPKPILAENPADKQRAAWMKQAMQTPEYRSLHEQTCLRGPMAGIASRTLYDQYVTYAADQPEGTPGPGDPEPGSDDEDIGTGVGRIRSTQEALAEAQENVDAAEGMAAGLGMGSGAQIDGDRLAEVFGLMRNSDLLRQIAIMAGRMISRCRSLQRQKLTAPHGEITGIELTGDVGRLLPLELAYIAGAVPALRTHALYRLSQRRMFGYKHKANQPVQNGPIVVGVDESGSMSGDRIIAAKALALAMAWLARQQKRWIALYSFGSSHEGRYICIPAGVTDDKVLLKWCESFYDGGTSMSTSCHTLPETWWKEMEKAGLPKGKTDHIIITDGSVDIGGHTIKSYKDWAKAETVKTYGLIIGTGYIGDSMAQIFDRHWLINDLSLNEEAVEQVLSI